MKRERQAEGERKEHQLADDEDRQILATRPRKVTLADGAGDDVMEVVMQMPAHRCEPIQQPHVEVLPAMVPIALLHRRKPCQHTQADVAVVAVDVDVGVMEVRMLPVPDVRAAADHVERHGHDIVDPAAFRIRLMAGIVLDVEADLRDRSAQHHTE